MAMQDNSAHGLETRLGCLQPVVTSLTHLDLTGTKLGDAGAMELAKYLLRDLPQQPGQHRMKLTRLKLNECSIGADGAEALAAALMLLGGATQLHVLQLGLARTGPHVPCVPLDWLTWMLKWRGKGEIRRIVHKLSGADGMVRASLHGHRMHTLTNASKGALFGAPVASSTQTGRWYAPMLRAHHWSLLSAYCDPWKASFSVSLGLLA